MSTIGSSAARASTRVIDRSISLTVAPPIGLAIAIFICTGSVRLQAVPLRSGFSRTLRTTFFTTVRLKPDTTLNVFFTTVRLKPDTTY